MNSILSELGWIKKDTKVGVSPNKGSNKAAYRMRIINQASHLHVGLKPLFPIVPCSLLLKR